MNRITGGAKQLYRDLRARKLRSFLTTLGIVWGTVAISLLLAIGDGFHHQLKKNSAGLGSAQAPMSYDDVADKTRGCAAAASWPAEKTEALISAVARIEEIGDIREVTALLC